MDPIRFIRFILYSGYKQCFSLPFADGCVCVLFVPNLFSTFGTYFCGRETPTKKCVLLIFHFIRSLARFIRFDSGQTYWWRTKLVYTKYIGHLMLVFPFVFHFPPADTCAVFYSPFLEFICFFQHWNLNWLEKGFNHWEFKWKQQKQSRSPIDWCHIL